MDNKFSFKFYEILLILEEAAKKFIEINNKFINEVVEYTKTEDGLKILQTIQSTLSGNNNIDENFPLKVKAFKSGLIIGADLKNNRIAELKALDEFLDKEENMDFIKNGECFNEGLILIIKKIDTAVDMFFTNFYVLNHKRKDNYFWNKYRDELHEMGVKIESISNELNDLKELRKIRNVYDHNNGDVDNQFINYFKINHHDYDVAKVNINSYMIRQYLVSSFNTVKYILKNNTDFNIDNVMKDCQNLLKLDKEYVKVKNSFQS